MEALQKISDAPLRDCPACNSPSLQKLVSAASFRLKGTGWYETDFKNKDKPKSETKENSVTSKEGNQEKQGESKKTSGNEAKDTKKADVA
nr:MAG: putative regulatory protein, FmdB family [Candidatus Kentron sp. LFY]